MPQYGLIKFVVLNIWNQTTSTSKSTGKSHKKESHSEHCTTNTHTHTHTNQYGPNKICSHTTKPTTTMYMVRQFNSWNSRRVSLECWVRQTRVLRHVWTCFNLRLHEPQTKWVVRSRAAEEVVRVRGTRLAEKWVTRIWNSG